MDDDVFASARWRSTPETPKTRATRFARQLARVRFLRDARNTGESRYLEMRRVWAEQNEGRFPDKTQLRDEAADELEVLCRALGDWAYLDPESSDWRVRIFGDLD